MAPPGRPASSAGGFGTILASSLLFNDATFLVSSKDPMVKQARRLTRSTFRRCARMAAILHGWIMDIDAEGRRTHH